MENNIINETLLLIKEQTGLSLKLCDYFTGIRTFKGRKYFNVLLDDRLSNSNEYLILERFAKKYGLISLEANGVKRVAIIINNKEAKQ